MIPDRSNTLKISGLILIAGCWLTVAAVNAQEDTWQSVHPLFDAAELKKLEKADGVKAEADKIMEEINLLNIQIISIEADTAVPKATIRKKTVSLENQTWQKHTQAAAGYEKCNQIRYDLCKEKIERYWKEHPGSETTRLNEKLLEEQASDRWFQARSYRTDARRMSDGKVKATRLTEAGNLETEALDKLVTALAGCHGIELAEPGIAGETDRGIAAQAEANRLADSLLALSGPGQSAYTLEPKEGINQAEIDRYNRYMEEGQRTDTTLSTGKIAGITSFDRDTILTLWYDYLYDHNETTPDIALTRPEKEVPAEVPAEVSVKEDLKASEIGRVTEENRSALIPADEEVIYRVQIAANRTELNQRALSRIYYGNKNVEMENENGWFKYSVGDFATFEEADRFRKSSGVDNAFVMAYRKGKRVAGETVNLEQERDQHPSPADTMLNLPPGLIFRIQVAASRIPLSANQLQQLQGDDYPVEMIREDGWYKYQLMGVRDFPDALLLKEKIAAKGAFVVAYNSGVKQRLADAVNDNRREKRTGNVSETEDSEFHVQLAAVRRLLKPEEIRRLYAGSLPVSLIMEDGWYKYHLKTGNSYTVARQVVNDCRVEGAFIVAYRMGRKIGIKEALQRIQ